MVNKNDLRYIKTERLIEETYLLLKKSRSSIKVSQLCQAALINKTTFYSHYETMDALHKSICRKEIDRILRECPHSLEAFSDAEQFVYSIVEGIESNRCLLDTLFGDDDRSLVSAFEAGLLNIYLRGTESMETEMKIQFAIGGASRLLIKNLTPERIRITIALIQNIL